MTLGAMGFGGILADDMGLGRRVQAIAYLVAVKEMREAEGSDGRGGDEERSDAAAAEDGRKQGSFRRTSSSVLPPLSITGRVKYTGSRPD